MSCALCRAQVDSPWTTDSGKPMCNECATRWHMAERELFAEMEETAGHRRLIRRTAPGTLRAIARRYGRQRRTA